MSAPAVDRSAERNAWWQGLPEQEKADRRDALMANASVLLVLREFRPHLLECPGCRQVVLTNGDGTFAVCAYCGEDLEKVHRQWRVAV